MYEVLFRPDLIKLSSPYVGSKPEPTKYLKLEVFKEDIGDSNLLENEFRCESEGTFKSSCNIRLKTNVSSLKSAQYLKSTTSDDEIDYNNCETKNVWSDQSDTAYPHHTRETDKKSEHGVIIDERSDRLVGNPCDVSGNIETGLISDVRDNDNTELTAEETKNDSISGASNTPDEYFDNLIYLIEESIKNL